MKKTLIALAAATALAGSALAQQQDPKQSAQQTPSPSDQQQGGQNAGQPDRQESPQSRAMNPSRSQIRMLQQALNRNGLNAGPVDGIMGDRTRQALQKFQSQNGLNASGQLDRQTIAALRSQRGKPKTTARTSKRMQPQNQGQQSGRY